MARVRAPDLVGRGWLGTDGRALRLADLRGRFVLLDFWTFCCINCLHVLDELRPVEQRWEHALTVVGVHAPKFRHEADPQALADAVARYGVTHPVLDDADLVTWQAYAARAWPTLVLLDPDGYVVGTFAGEGHAHAIDALLADLVPGAEQRGVLRSGTLRWGDLPEVRDDLFFPSSLVQVPDGRWLLVTDTAQHRLALLDAAGLTLDAVIGCGERGLRDGGPATAAFAEPQGLCLLPVDVAAAAGYDVVVADTANHALRGVRLEDGAVRTLAGTGEQWSPLTPTALSSPWGLAWWQQRVWVAMAGTHQLWTFDPLTGDARAVAGTRVEGLRDGPLDQAWFAQPSALAADGDRLWVADAETSALRVVQHGEVHTAVGWGLFDFGFRDGGRDEARLQHPLGVSVLGDGTVAVADTYNGALRRFDPQTGELATMVTGLAEPTAVALDGDELVVVESAAHRLVRVPASARVHAEGTAERSERPPTRVAPGELWLTVTFSPPPGQVLDERYGPATRLSVTATPPALLTQGEGAGADLQRRLVLDAAVGHGVLHVSASAASCDVDHGEGAACHLHQQDWGIPVVLSTDAPSQLVLALGGAG